MQISQISLLSVLFSLFCLWKKRISRTHTLNSLSGVTISNISPSTLKSE
jgi:hypothetical protein